MTACLRCGYDPDAKIAIKYDLLIQRDPPSLNSRMSNSKTRGREYRAERDAWCWLIREQRLKWLIPIATVDARRRITLTRVFDGRQRRRDHDNYVGGLKPVVDALVSEQIIFDDDAEHVDIFYSQIQGAHVGLRILVEIYE